MSPGALSEILNGTRVVSRKMAVKICDRLLLDPMDKAIVLKSFSEKRVTSTESEDATHYLKLSSDQFKLMSEWYYFGILAFMKTAHFKSDVDVVAERLGLTRAQVNQALERMIRLNVIQVEKDGTWVRGEAGHRTSDDIVDLSVVKSHLETLELAKTALQELKIDERDFTALTLPLDYEDLPEAKKMIRKFQNEFAEKFLKGKKPKEVFRIAVQVFPLSKRGMKDISKKG